MIQWNKYENVRWLLLLVAVALGLSTPVSFAQGPEDALRLATPGFGVGARALGMGNAYTGVASDYSAIFWNPAGLAQLQHGEFSMGLSYLNNRDNSTFFGNSEQYTNNATNLNALGVVYPVPVRRGSLVLAFGFNRGNNFTSGVSFNGFNPYSSIIQSRQWAPDGQPYPANVTMAEQLQLAVADTVTKTFFSPIRNRLTQIGVATEGGGLNNWSAGVAADVARNLSVGLTLTYLSGSYRYDRDYKEQDNGGIYSSPFPLNGTNYYFDLKELAISDFIDGDISGVNGKFGLLYRVPDRFRFGISVKTPTAFTIKESYGTTARSTFYTAVNGNSSYGPVDNNGSVEYDVHTPWVFSAGASVILRDLVLSGDIEYTDWTELEFANANADLIAQNKDVKSIFQATANLRGGAEYEIRELGLRLRGGFIYQPSPFKGDPSDFNQKYFTAGLGIALAESAMLDLAFAHGWWKTFRYNYPVTNRVVDDRVQEDIATNTFMATFTVRF